MKDSTCSDTILGCITAASTRANESTKGNEPVTYPSNNLVYKIQMTKFWLTNYQLNEKFSP